jgi:hypothetical protein
MTENGQKGCLEARHICAACGLTWPKHAAAELALVENARLGAALEWYADRKNYVLTCTKTADSTGITWPPVLVDDGQRAREALTPKPSAWAPYRPMECDLCHRIAQWVREDGQFRCNQCTRPEP